MDVFNPLAKADQERLEHFFSYHEIYLDAVWLINNQRGISRSQRRSFGFRLAKSFRWRCIKAFGLLEASNHLQTMNSIMQIYGRTHRFYIGDGGKILILSLNGPKFKTDCPPAD